MEGELADSASSLIEVSLKKAVATHQLRETTPCGLQLQKSTYCVVLTCLNYNNDKKERHGAEWFHDLSNVTSSLEK